MDVRTSAEIEITTSSCGKPGVQRIHLPVTATKPDMTPGILLYLVPVGSTIVRVHIRVINMLIHNGIPRTELCFTCTSVCRKLLHAKASRPIIYR